MKTVVISVGGSVLVPGSVDTDFIKGFVDVILEFTGIGNRAILITGGGRTSRQYQDAARKLSVDDQSLDWLGIHATRLNAFLLITAFRSSAYERVVMNPLEKVDTDKHVIVSGGFEPGNSTDLTALQLAETYGGEEVINLSNIDHVYSADPKKDTGAKKHESLSWDEFISIVGDKRIPGGNWPFDPVASRYAQERGMTVKVIGPDLANLRLLVKGRSFAGTVIC